jgi:D-serine deaminase-like pyridoxal phosphate-dependent protein
MRVTDLETPIPVIDLDRVEHNLSKMQAYCDSHGLSLRPHIKTHKIPGFAHRQLELGAHGITCQKLGEAEVMADAGLDDILLSYPLIGPAKASRLAALASRVTMRVAVDNAMALDTAARAARESGAEIGVLIEFDSGGKRTGVVSVDEALALAEAIVAAEGLRFDGLMTYPSSAATAGFVAAAKQRLGGAGIEIRTVSGGGTPNAWHQHEIEGLTELRVGTYIYHDRATVGVGAATLDECALHLHATVVSRPTETRAIIDAGSKSLSSDRVAPEIGEGYGLIREYPDAIIERLNEEHGILDLTRSARKPAIGERVRIVPNHVCVVTNLHDEVVTMRDGRVEAILPVAARGRTR